MSDVTQNRFDKYFGGSELVVAGKVLPSESNTLTSFITASAVSNDRSGTKAASLRAHGFVLQAGLDITLQTDADTAELDTELSKQEHSFTGFASQLWAFITVKQLLSER